MEASLKSYAKLDQNIFQLINSEWVHPILDSIMPVITDLHRVPWVIQYVIPALLILGFIMRTRKTFFVAFGITLSLLLVDLIAYRLIKNNIQRDRPEIVLSQVQLKTHSHSGHSFPSLHAANMFAAATIISAIFPRASYFVFFFAILVAYSRIYVGVHFPADVIGGAFIGSLSGWLVLKVIRYFTPRRWKYEVPWFAKS
ncbi:MAG: phosphatase PAP2 family protein [Bdellovibrionales bacterium]